MAASETATLKRETKGGYDHSAPSIKVRPGASWGVVPVPWFQKSGHQTGFSCFKTKELTQHFSPMLDLDQKPLSDAQALVLAELHLLRERLSSEGETSLLKKLEICQQPLKLKCLTCQAVKEVRQRCKRKWCPSCSKQLAADRAMDLTYMVERMRWPLFVTLTMKNVFDVQPSDIKRLRRAFGKLRHRKVWKLRVVGGVAAVEMTNIGNGWHPHLHCVVDCEWLAWKTPPPHWRDTPKKLKAKFKSAAQEVERTWSKILGQESSSVEICRAYKDTIAKEIVKYTVKNSDLVTCEGSAGDFIRALDSTRLLTSFGTMHGQCSRSIRSEAKAARLAGRKEFRESMQEFDCCPAQDLMPACLADNPKVDDRLQAFRRVGGSERARRWACEPGYGNAEMRRPVKMA